MTIYDDCHDDYETEPYEPDYSDREEYASDEFCARMADLAERIAYERAERLQ